MRRETYVATPPDAPCRVLGLVTPARAAHRPSVRQYHLLSFSQLHTPTNEVQERVRARLSASRQARTLTHHKLSRFCFSKAIAPRRDASLASISFVSFTSILLREDIGSLNVPRNLLLNLVSSLLPIRDILLPAREQSSRVQEMQVPTL